MATGSAMALKLVLRGFGVNVDELETKIQEVISIFHEFDLNELRAAMQMILDYKQDRIKNELRMKAIMEKLGIVDPALVLELFEQSNDKGIQ